MGACGIVSTIAKGSLKPPLAGLGLTAERAPEEKPAEAARRVAGGPGLAGARRLAGS